MRPVAVAPRPARLRHEVTAVRVLWQREMIRLFRSRARLLMTLLTPLLFLLVLGVGMGRMIDGDSPAATSPSFSPARC